MSEKTKAPKDKAPAATTEAAKTPAHAGATHEAAAHEAAAHADAHAEAHDGGHEPVVAERDRPPTALLTVLVAATVVTVAALVIGINEVFKSTVEGEISAKVLEHQAPALRELRLKEQDALSRYRWADQKQGAVRIPLERAIELTLADYKNKPVGQQAAPAPTPAPAPAPAPEQAPAPEPKK